MKNFLINRKDHLDKVCVQNRSTKVRAHLYKICKDKPTKEKKINIKGHKNH